MGGGICNSQILTLGSPNYPAQMRVYVAGTNACSQAGMSVRINSPVNFAANVYAPFGKYQSSSAIRHYGGIFAGSFTVGSNTEIHYDRAVLKAGATCGDDADAGVDAGVDGGCGSCRDCGNQACVQGACGACSSSADCCAPLVCAQGRCIAIPEIN